MISGPSGQGCDHLAEAAEAALAEENLALALEQYAAFERCGGDPDRCAGGRWMAAMLAGDFETAWQQSDGIRQRGAPDPHRFWQGEDLHGKRVILRSLHGFGDAVQMLRFLPRLQRQAKHLIVELPPKMVPLAPCFDGMGEVITWGEHAPAIPPDFDVQVEVMELPYLLRLTTGDLEPARPYLHLPEDAMRCTASHLGPRLGPRVGVAWCAGDWNPSRSLPFALLQDLLALPGLDFWSLQGGEERHAWQAVRSVRHRDVYECGEGLLPLAAAIACMDLVITVDTLAAHLAGALGVPCWLLLKQRADWRWMKDRENSPWYGSLRLYRQTGPDGWAALLRRVEFDLRAWRDETAGSPGPATLNFSDHEAAVASLGRL